MCVTILLSHVSILFFWFISSASLLPEFVPHLMLLTSSPSHTERVIAAKALVPFIPRENLLDRVEELAKLLPSPESTQGFSQNVLHGILLQIGALLEVIPCSAFAERANGLFKEMLKKSWICSLRNHCPLTRAAFLNIVMKYFSSFLKDTERGKWRRLYALYRCWFDYTVIITRQAQQAWLSFSRR